MSAHSRSPGSRRSPQFSRDAMPEWLGEAGIEYHHLQELTGRRRKQPEIPQELNAGWQNRSFKNYIFYASCISLTNCACCINLDDCM
mgnify:CR=1 FL=1